ncbi:unnamed protein product, partial [Mesorhabditis belari]|uniref:Transmembrane protein n=1 Tax=Mesorhabditis belari TaxID=2138241 RepID=A0AAF3FQZ2_9BILA
MPESVVPTAPPAYEDLPILPSAPPCSSPSISTGPPPDFSTNDDENVLNSTSAAPHLPSFPRFHSFRAENDRETQPPPYQFVELSVTQLDETEDARRIESEINMGVDGLMRRSEERDRLDDARRMRINQRCTGVVSRTAHTSTAHCHQHESCQENVEGNEACCWVAGCLLCGAVGCFVMGFCMIRRGITGGKKPHQQDRSYHAVPGVAPVTVSLGYPQIQPSTSAGYWPTSYPPQQNQVVFQGAQPVHSVHPQVLIVENCVNDCAHPPPCHDHDPCHDHFVSPRTRRRMIFAFLLFFPPFWPCLGIFLITRACKGDRHGHFRKGWCFCGFILITLTGLAISGIALMCIFGKSYDDDDYYRSTRWPRY